MTTRQAAVVALALLGAVGLALPAVAAAGQVDAATPTSDETGTENGTAPFGTQLTAFMQSSAAEADDTVEDGMWAAGFERANESERARLATNRTAKLERRLERLRERNETLTRRYENGSMDETAYVARASRLSGRMKALRTATDETDRVAGDGVDRNRLDRLRVEARNATGPPVDGVPAGVAAGHRGPPGERVGPERAPGRDDDAGPPAGPGGPTGPTGQSENQSGPGERGDDRGPSERGGGERPRGPGDGGANSNDGPGDGSNGGGKSGGNDKGNPGGGTSGNGDGRPGRGN